MDSESIWTSGQCSLEVSINLRQVGISGQHRLEVTKVLIAARFLEANRDRRLWRLRGQHGSEVCIFLRSARIRWQQEFEAVT